MTRLWWVRHGPTHEKAFTGWRDVPADLSDSAAIVRLNSYLPRHALLISSDLIRAIATADHLAANRQRLPHDPNLREFHFGDWDGKHWSDVAATHPDLSRRYWETPGDIAPPGGESWNTVAHRVNTAVTRLTTAHPSDDIIVVAHIGVILTQVQAARRCPPAEALSQSVDNLSVTRLDWSGTEWIERITNHIP